MADQVAPARGITRREFLNYVALASMALFTAEVGGAVLAFSLPRFREGEFGGTRTIGTIGDRLPKADSAPMAYSDVKTWIINVGAEAAAKGGGKEGLVALYKVCVHLGCLYAWVDSNKRFECPCHGSKYQLDGTYIEGPAPRDLDRFVVMLKDETGATIAQTNTDKSSPDYGAPLPIPANATNYTIVVDTGNRLDLGKQNFYKGGA